MSASTLRMDPSRQGDTFNLRDVCWVMTDKMLDDFIRTIGQSGVVVYDLETTGLDEHAWTGGPSNGGVAARVSLMTVTISENYTTEPTTFILPLSHPDSPWVGRWRDVLTRVARAMAAPMENAYAEDRYRTLVGQNIKFDHRWMYAMTGVDLTHCPLWDTRVSSHLLDENTSTSLKERAPRTFGVTRWDDFSLSSPGASELVPLMQLGEYGARDTYWTWRLYDLHKSIMTYDEDDPVPDVEAARLGDLAETVAMPTVQTLTAAEQRGLVLDVGEARETSERLGREVIDLECYLVERYDLPEEVAESEPSFAPTSKWFAAWSSAATDAGDLRITALTPTGKPQWSRQVLDKQARQGSEVAGKLLDLRKRVKQREFLTSWLGQVSSASTIHASYNAGSVVTGRLSSSNPNMQQVTKALRPMFKPRPGYVLADFDYSQIELRVAAHISGSEAMLDAYQAGEDLHSIIAAKVAGVPLAEVTPEQRQKGKAANFGLLYGMGPLGFQAYADTAYGVTLTDEEAAQVHQTFFDTWVGLREWHAAAITRAHRTGQVVSPIGRVRRLPDIHSGIDRLVSAAERAAINAPVQGFASDIMQLASSLIAGHPQYPEQRVERVHIVGTVHDSIIVEVPEDGWEQRCAQIREVMITGVLEPLQRLGCNLAVPLDAGCSVGTAWGLDDVGSA